MAVFRSRFCTESVQIFVRNPYKILYGFRTKNCTDSVHNFVRVQFFFCVGPIFGFRIRHRFLARIPSTFLYGFRTIFCTDSVHESHRMRARSHGRHFGGSESVYGFRTKKCTDSVQKSVRNPPQKSCFRCAGPSFQRPRTARASRPAGEPSALGGSTSEL